MAGRPKTRAKRAEMEKNAANGVMADAGCDSAIEAAKTDGEDSQVRGFVRGMLDQPVKNADGSELTGMQHLMMALRDQAVKGDTNAIMTLMNLAGYDVQPTVPETDREAQRRADEDRKKRRKNIINLTQKRLKGDGLYCNELYDFIELVADRKIAEQNLRRQMEAPGFTPTIVEISREGTSRTKPNPIIQMVTNASQQTMDAVKDLYRAARQFAELKKKGMSRDEEKSSLKKLLESMSLDDDLEEAPPIPEENQ